MRYCILVVDTSLYLFYLYICYHRKNKNKYKQMIYIIVVSIKGSNIKSLDTCALFKI